MTFSDTTNGHSTMNHDSTASNAGSEGSQSSSIQQSQTDNSHAPSLYKTELCRTYVDTGTCRYGVKCRFAHGDTEVRPVARHKKYKTERCKNYVRDGICPYGHRCRFIHELIDEPDYLLSPSTYPYSVSEEKEKSRDHAITSLSLNSQEESNPSQVYVVAPKIAVSSGTAEDSNVGATLTENDGSSESDSSNLTSTSHPVEIGDASISNQSASSASTQSQTQTQGTQKLVADLQLSVGGFGGEMTLPASQLSANYVPSPYTVSNTPIPTANGTAITIPYSVYGSMPLHGIGTPSMDTPTTGFTGFASQTSQSPYFLPVSGPGAGAGATTSGHGQSGTGLYGGMSVTEMSLSTLDNPLAGFSPSIQPLSAQGNAMNSPFVEIQLPTQTQSQSDKDGIYYGATYDEQEEKLLTEIEAKDVDDTGAGAGGRTDNDADNDIDSKNISTKTKSSKLSEETDSTGKTGATGAKIDFYDSQHSSITASLSATTTASRTGTPVPLSMGPYGAMGHGTPFMYSDGNVQYGASSMTGPIVSSHYPYNATGSATGSVNAYSQPFGGGSVFISSAAASGVSTPNHMPLSMNQSMGMMPPLGLGLNASSQQQMNYSSTSTSMLGYGNGNATPGLDVNNVVDLTSSFGGASVANDASLHMGSVSSLHPPHHPHSMAGGLGNRMYDSGSFDHRNSRSASPFVEFGSVASGSINGTTGTGAGVGVGGTSGITFPSTSHGLGYGYPAYSQTSLNSGSHTPTLTGTNPGAAPYSQNYPHNHTAYPSYYNSHSSAVSGQNGPTKTSVPNTGRPPTGPTVLSTPGTPMRGATRSGVLTNTRRMTSTAQGAPKKVANSTTRTKTGTNDTSSGQSFPDASKPDDPDTTDLDQGLDGDNDGDGDGDVEIDCDDGDIDVDGDGQPDVETVENDLSDMRLTDYATNDFNTMKGLDANGNFLSSSLHHQGMLGMSAYEQNMMEISSIGMNMNIMTLSGSMTVTDLSGPMNGFHGTHYGMGNTSSMASHTPMGLGAQSYNNSPSITAEHPSASQYNQLMSMPPYHLSGSSMSSSPHLGPTSANSTTGGKYPSGVAYGGTYDPMGHSINSSMHMTSHGLPTSGYPSPHGNYGRKLHSMQQTSSSSASASASSSATNANTSSNTGMAGLNAYGTYSMSQNLTGSYNQPAYGQAFTSSGSTYLTAPNTPNMNLSQPISHLSISEMKLNGDEDRGLSSTNAWNPSLVRSNSSLGSDSYGTSNAPLPPTSHTTSMSMASPRRTSLSVASLSRSNSQLPPVVPSKNSQQMASSSTQSQLGASVTNASTSRLPPPSPLSPNPSSSGTTLSLSRSAIALSQTSGNGLTSTSTSSTMSDNGSSSRFTFPASAGTGTGAGAGSTGTTSTSVNTTTNTTGTSQSTSSSTNTTLVSIAAGPFSPSKNRSASISTGLPPSGPGLPPKQTTVARGSNLNTVNAGVGTSNSGLINSRTSSPHIRKSAMVGSSSSSGNVSARPGTSSSSGGNTTSLQRSNSGMSQP